MNIYHQTYTSTPSRGGSWTPRTKQLLAINRHPERVGCWYCFLFSLGLQLPPEKVVRPPKPTPTTFSGGSWSPLGFPTFRIEINHVESEGTPLADARPKTRSRSPTHTPTISRDVMSDHHSRGSSRNGVYSINRLRKASQKQNPFQHVRM